MPIRNIIKDENQHLYNRGVSKNDIFLCHKDYLRFMCLVKVCNQNDTKPLSSILRKKTFEQILNEDYRQDYVDIITGRLMPNHWHMAGSSKIDGGISIFMQRVLASYSTYFNKKYNKSGYTFEGRYKSRQVEDDFDLMNLVSYIKMNPLSLVKEDYSHDRYANGEIELTAMEEEFIENYPYRLGKC